MEWRQLFRASSLLATTIYIYLVLECYSQALGEISCVGYPGVLLVVKNQAWMAS